MFARAPLHKLALLDYSADYFFKVLHPLLSRVAELYINKHLMCLSTPFFLSISGLKPSIFHPAVFGGGFIMLPNAKGVCQHFVPVNPWLQVFDFSRFISRRFAAEFVCYQTP